MLNEEQKKKVEEIAKEIVAILRKHELTFAEGEMVLASVKHYSLMQTFKLLIHQAAMRATEEDKSNEEKNTNDKENTL